VVLSVGRVVVTLVLLEVVEEVDVLVLVDVEVVRCVTA